MVSDIHPATKRTNGPVWSQVLASQWNTELISLAQPGATFCQNNKKNGSWLKKQVEKDTTLSLSESSNVHVIFLGSTDLVETKGNGMCNITITYAIRFDNFCMISRQRYQEMATMCKGPSGKKCKFCMNS